MSEQIVYLAGVEWDDIPGTDRKLATALAAHTNILWIDPPISVARYATAMRAGQRWDIGLCTVSPGITRLRILVSPGTSRPIIRDLISWYLSRKIRSAVSAGGQSVGAVINASPEAVFPAGVPGRRLFYITDDWVAGAVLIGMKSTRVWKRMLRNVNEADATATVSAGLAEKFGITGADIAVIPNGCNPIDLDAYTGHDPRPADLPSGPLVGLVGQINERIDVSLVLAVADAGATVVVIGPRTERLAPTGKAIDELFAHPSVHWLGAKPAEQLPDYLRALAVGITPYADTQFNRLSFPLKTLEYLGAGLPVVSSDLPSVTWLDTSHIRVAGSPRQFAELVMELMIGDTATAAPERIMFARNHSWDARASKALGLLDVASADKHRHEQDFAWRP